MVSRAHAYGLAVAQLGDVMRVDALDREGDDAAAMVEVGRPEEADVLDLGQPLERVGGELALVGADVLHADRSQVVDGGAEADGLGRGGGAGLELEGQLVPGRALALDSARSCDRRRGTAASPRAAPARPCSIPIVGPSALCPVQA